MNLLVLQPDYRSLMGSLFVWPRRSAVFTADPADLPSREVNIADALGEWWALAQASTSVGGLDAVAVRVPFGGDVFPAPAAYTPEVRGRLETLSAHSPLHLPAALAAVDACLDLFGDIPIILVFETAFFADLPEREQLYGLKAGLGSTLGPRRYGYHGLYHEAACRWAARRLRRHPGPSGLIRTLSICLEPRPEAAAVVGRRPVMVTGGATPLEGLPGETTCGELDPSIVLTLAEKCGWGAEQINLVLTRESGLRGLCGRAVSLREALTGDGPELQLAGNVFRYRLLLAAGAGVAAAGGLDVVVFSGRYADVGGILGPWLVRSLGLRSPTIGWQIFRSPRDRLIAEAAARTLRTAAVTS